MYSPDELRSLTYCYLGYSGLSASALGARVVGNKKWFKGLLRGRDVKASNAEIVSEFFNSNWPGDLAWPEGVPDRRDQQRGRRDGAGAGNAAVHRCVDWRHDASLD